MNPEEAYQFFNTRMDKTICSIASEFIVLNNLGETAHDSVRRKFSSQDRREFQRRGDTSTWNAVPFYTQPKHPRLSTGSQYSDEDMVIGSASSNPIYRCFLRRFSRPTRKPLNELSTKGLRNRLSSLQSHLDTVTEQENVSSKELSNYLMMLCSQTEYYFDSASFCI